MKFFNRVIMFVVRCSRCRLVAEHLEQLCNTSCWRMPFAPTPMKNVSDDEKIAPAEAVPRSGAKRNEEYKRKTGRVMMGGGLLGFEKRKERMRMSRRMRMSG